VHKKLAGREPGGLRKPRWSPEILGERLSEFFVELQTPIGNAFNYLPVDLPEKEAESRKPHQNSQKNLIT